MTVNSLLALTRRLRAEKLQYLSHVDEPEGQGFVAQDGPVLVSLPPLQHDLKLVGVPFQEVWIL